MDKVSKDAQVVEFNKVHVKVFKDVKDFKAQAVEFSKVHVQVKAVVKECMCFRSRTELESRSRSGRTGTTRTDRLSRTECWRCTGEAPAGGPGFGSLPDC